MTWATKSKETNFSGYADGDWLLTSCVPEELDGTVAVFGFRDFNQ
jgi:hypothetical protein